ncbi:MAG TPA: lytic transglycosylase domain-containing protein [Bryobacteraceae bacterium]|nr:lytic transglycosylase domain-containing protein [Bryobacteraceae bacterium]
MRIAELKRWAILLALAGPALAGEYVVFSSGARMRVERHSTEGGKVVLYSTTGTSEIDSRMIRGFEPEDYVPPAQPVAPSAAPAPAPPPRDLADAAAGKYGLPKSLVRGVMAAESGFRPDAVSPKGARGLMQLMPGTAAALGADAADPRQNVDAGARYLRDLLQKYHYGLYHALAAYNAGPGAVDKYRGVPPYAETLTYIQRVLRNYKP